MKHILDIIHKYYDPNSLAYYYLIEHSKAVTEKALEVALRVKDLDLDIQFIKEACMLHDIGIIKCNASSIGCHGAAPYIAHGVLGAEMLRQEGLLRHSLVCERHVGVGLTAEEIIQKGLPLIAKDMIPITLEEKVICFADKFFSKSKGKLYQCKPIDVVCEEIARYAADKLEIFKQWLKLFKEI